MQHAPRVRGFLFWLHLMMKGRDAVDQDVFLTSPFQKQPIACARRRLSACQVSLGLACWLVESRHIYVENQRIKSSRDVLFKHLHHYETMFFFRFFLPFHKDFDRQLIVFW